MTQVERELEHELGVDTDVNADVPATLDEHQQNIAQMDKLAEATVAPGLFRLPGSVVTSSPDSKRWNVAVDHPTVGELNFRYSKPTKEGWVDGQELVDLLRWYGIHDRDPYKLQTEILYVAYKGDEAETPHGYEIVKPPHYSEPTPPRSERIKQRAKDIAGWRPPRNVAVVWGLLFAASIVAPWVASVLTAAFSLPIVGTFLQILTAGMLFVAATIVALAVTEP